MRYIHVAVPAGRRESVTELLDEKGFDYTVTDETGDDRYVSLVSFPAPIEAVEPLLAGFSETGLDRESHVVVQDAEAVLSTEFDELQDRYDERFAGERIAHEEIRREANDLVPDWTTYVLLTVVSAVVATAGLLLDAASIVVGSMVIAPLVGPALSTGVGTVLYNEGMFRKGTKYQLLGFGMAIVAAAAFAALVRTFFLVPPNVEITALDQVAGRLSPDLLALAVALGAGAAGARSLETDISTPLVGVMMAAALVPPTLPGTVVSSRGARRPDRTVQAGPFSGSKLGVYIRSDGTQTPARFEIHGPCLHNPSTLPETAEGEYLPHPIAALGSLDVVPGSTDRWRGRSVAPGVGDRVTARGRRGISQPGSKYLYRFAHRVVHYHASDDPVCPLRADDGGGPPRRRHCRRFHGDPVQAFGSVEDGGL